MRRRALVPLVLTLGLLAAGCASDDGTTDVTAATGQEVLAVEDILVDEPVFTNGANGVVTLQLGTTVDVGCNIVFGPDPSFGTLATDQDMSDGAHDLHTVVLGELEPGSVVHYQLQGADERGRLYRSQPTTFVVPEPGSSTLDTGDPRADADARENLALGADTTTSSDFSDAFAGSNATDGNPATEWSSAGDGDDAFVEVDLGAQQEVGAVGFWTRDMSDGTAVIESVRVLVDDVEVVAGEVGPDLTVLELPQPVAGQLVRFEAVTTTGGNTGAVEVEVYPAG